MCTLEDTRGLPTISSWIGQLVHERSRRSSSRFADTQEDEKQAGDGGTKSGYFVHDDEVR